MTTFWSNNRCGTRFLVYVGIFIIHLQILPHFRSPQRVILSKDGAATLRKLHKNTYPLHARQSRTCHQFAILMERTSRKISLRFRMITWCGSSTFLRRKFMEGEESLPWKRWGNSGFILLLCIVYD